MSSDKDEEEFITPAQKRARRLRNAAAKFGSEHSSSKFLPPSSASPPVGPRGGERQVALLEVSRKLRREEEQRALDNPHERMDKIAEEEAYLLMQMKQTQREALKGAKERSSGVVLRKTVKTSYSLPEKYQNCPPQIAERFREKFFIDVSGDNIPAPIASFAEMKLPPPICELLLGKDIRMPTQIQMQGIPASLMGRDVIGVAFTGSGKTLVFSIPAVMRAMEMESILPLGPHEGPICLIIAPSRELASQIFRCVEELTDALARDPHRRYPPLRNLLLMGGLGSSEIASALRRGVHVVVATPGRLIDSLTKKRAHLEQCVLLALDEADRMVEGEMGFEEEIRTVFDFMGPHDRQILLFSATMPRKIEQFAQGSLCDPIVINVGRAGAANLDVIQEIEYVKEEEKMRHLLSALNKTPPPVLIFCEHKREVDNIHEYLLLKGVETCAIHGSMAQEERAESLRLFREHKKDVLIGTDVASKGLDFPAIQHVINFDMPREIENYVHRIGRTGRGGRTGIATTMVNKNTEESVLLDLKAVLIEAKQKIPPFLNAMDTERVSMKRIGGVRGCAYCGGLGHRIAKCPKMAHQQRMAGLEKDLLQQGSKFRGAEDTKGYGGDW
eukprot:GHVH01016215.1.p1 GENE.GHVH01016215.1~~GHVH01016215.1.p1  ORF type:complete len:615 (+),score=119.01 GHVH01016215.1:157-2001(+)